MEFNTVIKRIVLVSALLLPAIGWAAKNETARSYESHPDALALIDELVAEHAFDRQKLLGVFAEARYRNSIVQLMDKPAESKPWSWYQPRVVSNKRVKEGRVFLQQHRETLERAEKQFGVPVEVIVAIIGVETSYGKNKGSTRVIDALSTLAFDYPRRSVFFRKELKSFLVLTRDEQVTPSSLKGSYAGAMGYGQFMPSSFQNYAIDFDGDGHRDIWNNPVDAIGSVANYFARHGWKKGAPVTSQASFTGDANSVKWVKGRRNLKPAYQLSELVALGLKPSVELAGDQPATPIRFNGVQGKEYWVGLHNFYVITRYNHSSLYAMAVYQLSQKIAKSSQ